ncbi:MAG: signal peptidase I [Lachnospiraceae bacterium]|nr:signal peptidase I [Lachnospiraceae bacterium]
MEEKEIEQIQESAENQTPEQKPEEKESFKKVFWEYVRMFAGVIVVVLLLQNFVFINARIPSASMENTVMTGDRIFGNRLAYTFGEPERYDIAIFRAPDDESKLFIKRVIGLPGETVTIREDGIYINDAEEPLSEEFCPEQPDYTQWIGMSWTVPEDCYFMLGDNRNNSGDSRFWNNPFVSGEKVLAKASFRYWPLNQISVLEQAKESYFEPETEAAE